MSQYTLGGGSSPITRPNTEPTKGQWARYPAFTLKTHRGGATESALHTARIYIQTPSDVTDDQIRAMAGSRPELQALYRCLYSPGGYGWVDFWLQGMSVTYQERQQIQVAQNDAFVEYFFGSQPSQIQLQGLLLDTYQDDWYHNAVDAYYHILRGTVMARKRQRVSLRVYDKIYQMSVAGMATSLSASAPGAWSFSMSGTLYETTRVPDKDRQHTLATDTRALFRQHTDAQTRGQAAGQGAVSGAVRVVGNITSRTASPLASPEAATPVSAPQGAP